MNKIKKSAEYGLIVFVEYSFSRVRVSYNKFHVFVVKVVHTFIVEVGRFHINCSHNGVSVVWYGIVSPSDEYAKMHVL